MKTTHIPLYKRIDDSYDIEIFRDGFDYIANDLEKKGWYKHFIIITDSNTGKLFAGGLFKSLKKRGFRIDLIEVPAGEKSKKWIMAGKLLSELVELNTTRKSCILALGGGVVGDLAGFVASVYMRGIDYIQIPTSILAMVDSSVGGKTGVDLPEGKNLAGTFWQPRKVYMALHVLESLPARQIRTGLAEVIKYGCIWDRSLFRYLEKTFKKMLKKQRKISKDQEALDISWLTKPEYEKALTRIIKTSVQIKRGIVKKDEKETRGIRAMLNYGHTIGHAIEFVSGYRFTHGEAISIGMHYEALLAQKLGLLRANEVERQKSLLDLVGLPTEIPPKMNRGRMLEVMKSDKKSPQGKIGCALIRKIGKPVKRFIVIVSEKEMQKIIQ